MNYYPFGLKHKGYNNVISSNGNSVAQRKKFGGFELQDELDLDWYDMTARNYDPALGRWMNLDPLTEKMRRHSPYNYAFNNPVYWIDPDGMEPQSSQDPEVEKKSSTVVTYTAVKNRKGVHEFKSVNTESTVTTTYTTDSEGNNVVNKTTESRTTTNTVRFRAVVDENGNNNVKIEQSTEKIESSITETKITVRDNDMGGTSVNTNTIATNLDGKDGTTNIDFKDQPASIRREAHATKIGIKRKGLDYVPIKHALNDIQATAVGILGGFNPYGGAYVSGAAGLKRGYDAMSDFNGETVVIKSSSSTRKVKN